MLVSHIFIAVPGRGTFWQLGVNLPTSNLMLKIFKMEVFIKNVKNKLSSAEDCNFKIGFFVFLS